MSKVFITQENKNNFSSAKSYGDISFIVSSDFNVHQADSDNNIKTINRIKRLADMYNPKEDYIIPTGDPIIIGIVFFKLLSKHGVINCLKYDRQTKDYNLVKIDYDILKHLKSIV